VLPCLPSPANAMVLLKMPVLTYRQLDSGLSQSDSNVLKTLPFRVTEIMRTDCQLPEWLKMVENSKLMGGLHKERLPYISKVIFEQTADCTVYAAERNDCNHHYNLAPLDIPFAAHVCYHSNIQVVLVENTHSYLGGQLQVHNKGTGSWSAERNEAFQRLNWTKVARSSLAAEKLDYRSNIQTSHGFNKKDWTVDPNTGLSFPSLKSSIQHDHGDLFVQTSSVMKSFGFRMPELQEIKDRHSLFAQQIHKDNVVEAITTMSNMFSVGCLKMLCEAERAVVYVREIVQKQKGIKQSDFVDTPDFSPGTVDLKSTVRVPGGDLLEAEEMEEFGDLGFLEPAHAVLENEDESNEFAQAGFDCDWISDHDKVPKAVGGADVRGPVQKSPPVQNSGSSHPWFTRSSRGDKFVSRWCNGQRTAFETISEFLRNIILFMLFGRVYQSFTCHLDSGNSTVPGLSQQWGMYTVFEVSCGGQVIGYSRVGVGAYWKKCIDQTTERNAWIDEVSQCYVDWYHQQPVELKDITKIYDFLGDDQVCCTIPLHMSKWVHLSCYISAIRKLNAKHKLNIHEVLELVHGYTVSNSPYVYECILGGWTAAKQLPPGNLLVEYINKARVRMGSVESGPSPRYAPSYGSHRTIDRETLERSLQNLAATLDYYEYQSREWRERGVQIKQKEAVRIHAQLCKMASTCYGASDLKGQHMIAILCGLGVIDDPVIGCQGYVPGTMADEWDTSEGSKGKTRSTTKLADLVQMATNMTKAEAVSAVESHGHKILRAIAYRIGCTMGDAENIVCKATARTRTEIVRRYRDTYFIGWDVVNGRHVAKRMWFDYSDRQPRPAERMNLRLPEEDGKVFRHACSGVADHWFRTKVGPTKRTSKIGPKKRGKRSADRNEEVAGADIHLYISAKELLNMNPEQRKRVWDSLNYDRQINLKKENWNLPEVCEEGAKPCPIVSVEASKLVVEKKKFCGLPPKGSVSTGEKLSKSAATKQEKVQTMKKTGKLPPRPVPPKTYTRELFRTMSEADPDIVKKMVESKQLLFQPSPFSPSLAKGGLSDKNRECMEEMMKHLRQSAEKAVPSLTEITRLCNMEECEYNKAPIIIQMAAKYTPVEGTFNVFGDSSVDEDEKHAESGVIGLLFESMGVQGHILSKLMGAGTWDLDDVQPSSKGGYTVIWHYVPYQNAPGKSVTELALEEVVGYSTDFAIRLDEDCNSEEGSMDSSFVCSRGKDSTPSRKRRSPRTYARDDDGQLNRITEEHRKLAMSVADLPNSYPPADGSWDHVLALSHRVEALNAMHPRYGTPTWQMATSAINRTKWIVPCPRDGSEVSVHDLVCGDMVLYVASLSDKARGTHYCFRERTSLGSVVATTVCVNGVQGFLTAKEAVGFLHVSMMFFDAPASEMPLPRCAYPDSLLKWFDWSSPDGLAEKHCIELQNKVGTKTYLSHYIVVADPNNPDGDPYLIVLSMGKEYYVLGSDNGRWEPWDC